MNDRTNATKPGRRFALGAASIFLVTFAVYWPALRGQFVWDDLLLIDKNPLVTGNLNPFTVWFQTDFPLTITAFWAQWLLWAKNAAGYHIVNVLLHTANCLLLWRVLKRLKIPGSWIAAVLFAVHPVCVTSVAWISEMKNTLSVLFFLLSVFFFLKFDDEQLQKVASKLTRGYWLSLATFLLALSSKTSTVMLPVTLLGCAWWRRGRITRRDFQQTIPFFLLALAFGSMTIWFQKHGAIGTATVQTENFPARLALAGKAVWFYLGKAFLPLNLNLMYPRWEAGGHSAVLYLPLCLLIAAFAICRAFRRGWGRHALFALAFFTVNLFPVLGLFDMYFLTISRVSDHFQYLSLIAVAAAVGAALNSFLKPVALKFAVPVLVVALSILTAQRARVFADEETLWRDTLAKNPSAWSAHNNLGVVLAEQGKIADAMQQFEISLQLYPQNAKAHINLGRALVLQNNFSEAEAHFQAALEIKPQDADAHKFYAQALAGQGRVEDAVKHLREGIQIEPDANSRLQLAALLHQTGDIREAIAQCRGALSMKPEAPEALSNLAWLLATAWDDSLRNGAMAVKFAEQACRLTNFKDARMLGTLAAAYAESGRFNEAVSTAQKAVDLATATGDTQFAAVNQQLLNLYRSGQPYHEPAPVTDRPPTQPGTN